MCSLIIDETFVDDSAIFTCQASSLAGFAQTSAALNVEECQVDGELIPPEFTEPLLETVAKEGQSHKLTCQVIEYPLPEISWSKDGTCIDHCSDFRATNITGDADTSAYFTVEPLEPTEVQDCLFRRCIGCTIIKS